MSLSARDTRSNPGRLSGLARGSLAQAWQRGSKLRGTCRLTTCRSDGPPASLRRLGFSPSGIPDGHSSTPPSARHPLISKPDQPGSPPAFSLRGGTCCLRLCGVLRWEGQARAGTLAEDKPSHLEPQGRGTCTTHVRNQKSLQNSLGFIGKREQALLTTFGENRTWYAACRCRNLVGPL